MSSVTCLKATPTTRSSLMMSSTNRSHPEPNTNVASHLTASTLDHLLSSSSKGVLPPLPSVIYASTSQYRSNLWQIREVSFRFNRDFLTKGLNALSSTTTKSLEVYTIALLKICRCSCMTTSLKST